MHLGFLTAVTRSFLPWSSGEAGLPGRCWDLHCSQGSLHVGT